MTIKPSAPLYSYRVIGKEEFLTYKVSYDIEVRPVNNRLPTKGELAEIATKLRSRKHDKTFVCFYLPGMVLDAGAFATGHSTPSLQINVMPFMIPNQHKRFDV